MSKATEQDKPTPMTVMHILIEVEVHESAFGPVRSTIATRRTTQLPGDDPKLVVEFLPGPLADAAGEIHAAVQHRLQVCELDAKKNGKSPRALG